jgi:hypothetical protein
VYGNVGSPVNIRASSSPTAGHTISGWWIYADGVGAYNSGAVSAINANLGLKVGTHTLMVRAWDTSGAYGDQTLLLTVSSKPAVAVSTPEPGSSVNSPIHIQASATSACSRCDPWLVHLFGRRSNVQCGRRVFHYRKCTRQPGAAYVVNTRMGFRGSIWGSEAFFASSAGCAKHQQFPRISPQ